MYMQRLLRCQDARNTTDCALGGQFVCPGWTQCWTGTEAELLVAREMAWVGVGEKGGKTAELTPHHHRHPIPRPLLLE